MIMSGYYPNWALTFKSKKWKTKINAKNSLGKYMCYISKVKLHQPKHI